MKAYKITFWKFVKPSINIIVSLIFFFIFMGILMLGLHYRDGHIPIILVVLTIFLVLMFCVPNIVLHINYFNEDRKKELSIDFINNKVTLSRHGNEKVFFLTDIVKVVRIGSALNEFNTIAPWRYFYYYKIELQDGSSILLTRFMVQNIEKVIPNLYYEYLHQRFPIVKNI